MTNTSSMKYSNSVVKIDTSHPVLVTGATGYVAGVLVRELLQHGVTVHATVRDPSNTDRLEYLRRLAKTSSTGEIKFFRGNLLEDGSFGQAMEGCSIVFHTASPFIWNAQDDNDPYKELIDPALKGTMNVLNQATKTASVKRVVLTSSVMAMYLDAVDCMQYPSNSITEDSWNRSASSTNNPYAYSKTVAELKAWTIAGSQTQWSMVVINPALVLGPGLKYHAESESYRIMKMYGDGTMAASGAPNIPLGVVDVRDVATAHVAAAYHPTASGRYVVSGCNTNSPDICASLKKKYNEYKTIPVGPLRLPKTVLWLLAPYIGMSRSYIWNNLNYDIQLDNRKSVQELGLVYRPLEETTQDMFQQMIDAGVFPNLNHGDDTSTTNSEKRERPKTE